MTLSHPAYELTPGSAPLLISIPHLGTQIPAGIRSQLSETSAELRDTDWHLDRLYAFAADLGAAVLRARISRYVIDLNRPPGGESLYPGQTTTGLVPAETFRGEPLYPAGHAPDGTEVERRVKTYYRPYHIALAAELARLKDLHGQVVLWEAHSIASVLPRLFHGKLPDLNFGTADGRACSAALIEEVLEPVRRQTALSHVLNGRFKGGYITRHYGQPSQGVHAIQLEMCQSLYMQEEPPFSYLPEAAGGVQPLLREMLAAAAQQVQRLA